MDSPTPMTTASTLAQLVDEYDRALAYTDALRAGLTEAQLTWRASDEASSIAWHLAHQPAVAHYMVRNLTAAEPRLDEELERIADSATDERSRGDLPPIERISALRSEVADRVRFRIRQIDAGNVGAPAQLRTIAHTMLTAIVNHEYQHSKWIGEVRVDAHGLDLPPAPTSALLTEIDGYTILA